MKEVSGGALGKAVIARAFQVCAQRDSVGGRLEQVAPKLRTEIGAEEGRAGGPDTEVLEGTRNVWSSEFWVYGVWTQQEKVNSRGDTPDLK